jgi:histidine ammonia-lyase
LNSGLMIAQYTAASLVSENKVLAHPASVDSIPTSANQEDHNSMGSISAQKAWRVLKNVQTVLAIELLCGCQGLDFARTLNNGTRLTAGTGTEAAYQFVRKQISHLDHDRVLYHEIQKALRLVEDAGIIRSVEKKIGSLD